jgi:putative endonuclease
MFYVYILKLKNNRLYTGFTTNLKERIGQHKKGKVISTQNLRPLLLIHYECYIMEEDARRREKFLKTSDGKMFLNRQISAYLKKIGRYKDF